MPKTIKSFPWILACGLWFAAAFPMLAEEADVPHPGTDVYLINLPTARTLKPNVFELRFLHRFLQSSDESDEHTLWGLDGPAKIGLGFEAGLPHNLQAGLYRYSLRENWEVSGKWFIGALKAVPSHHALRAGINWLTDVTVSPENDNYAFVQWISDFRLHKRVYLHLVPSYAVNNSSSTRDGFSLPAALSIRIRPTMHLLGEYFPENEDVPGSTDGWAVGFDKKIGGHDFTIIVTNTTATNVSDYVAGDLGFQSRDFRLAFNLARRFERRKK